MQVHLPPWALAAAPGANQDWASPGFRVTLASPVHPPGVYEVTLADGRLRQLQGQAYSSSTTTISSSNSSALGSSNVSAGSDGSGGGGEAAASSSSSWGGYTCSRVWAPSHDGVRVPLTVIHKEGLPLDGSAPALLHVYGAYGQVSLAPYMYVGVFVVIYQRMLHCACFCCLLIVTEISKI